MEGEAGAAAALRAPTLLRPLPIHHHFAGRALERQAVTAAPIDAAMTSAAAVLPLLAGRRLVAQSGVHCRVDLNAHLQARMRDVAPR